MSTTEKVICECGAPMVLRYSRKYKTKDGKPKTFYGCSRFPNCVVIISAHPNGQPASSPADAETREWRRRAHEEFDKLWQKWGYTRDQSYELLQSIMGLSKDEAHIGFFTKEQCQRLIILVNDEVKPSSAQAMAMDKSENRSIQEN